MSSVFIVLAVSCQLDENKVGRGCVGQKLSCRGQVDSKHARVPQANDRARLTELTVKAVPTIFAAQCLIGKLRNSYTVIPIIHKYENVVFKNREFFSPSFLAILTI